ncbi:MAG: hypothetical protein IKX36_05115 [Prevotella sp.]|nr:hypothetical protein [Prevotella sp.]
MKHPMPIFAKKSRIWHMLQERVEKKIAKKAMKKLQSLPDGVEIEWYILFWGEIDSPKGFILRHPILFLKLLFVTNIHRIIERFLMEVKEDGRFIVDISSRAGLIGIISIPIFRNKENLLKKFSEIHETKMSSGGNTNIYYVKRSYEMRNGKRKPLQLYRIPRNSTTGIIRIHTEILCITAVALNGSCIARWGDVQEGKDIIQLEEELQENDCYIFDNDYRTEDTCDYSWYEIKNPESHDLLMLILPVDA